jgi:methionyl aminopeptidase
MTITLKTEEEIAAMRVACRLASEVLDYIAPHVRPGITTGALRAAWVSPLPQIHLHLGEPPGLPRHPRR